MTQDEKRGRTANGRFAPGNSGNPRGSRKREVRRDGYVNAFTGHGTARDRRTATTFAGNYVSDLEAIDLRRCNWLAKRMCELLPADAMRRGYEIKIDNKEKAEAIQAITEDLHYDKKIAEAGQLARTCGGAALFPVLEGAQDGLETELDPGRIVGVRALHLLEPRELQPVDWYQDIAHPKFGKPKTYRLWPLSGGRGPTTSFQTVHESRLAIFPGVTVTREGLPGQRVGWGDSVLTPAAEALADYGLSWGSAATILHNFSQRVIKYKGLMDMLRETGGEAVIQKRVEMQDMVSNTLRALPLDAEDDLVNVSTSVGGLAELLREMNQLVSAIADMPMTRLFGMSPAGLNATGLSDMEGWYERVGGLQSEYTPIVEWLIKLIIWSTEGPLAGKEPDVWSIQWRPLQKPSEKEQAETRKLLSEADKNWVEMGAASPMDVAESHWGGDTFSAELTVDIDAIEAEMNKADEEQAAALENAAAAVAAIRPGAPGQSNPNANGSANENPNRRVA